jgi:hypothetical protein
MVSFYQFGKSYPNINCKQRRKSSVPDELLSCHELLFSVFPNEKNEMITSCAKVLQNFV